MSDNNSATIVYLHGFKSSSRSEKAEIFSNYLRSINSPWQFYSPNLPFSPSLTLKVVTDLLAEYKQKKQSVVLIGSSMGGFYASYFSQAKAVPSVLINPAVEPQSLFEELRGQELENTYTGEKHLFSTKDMDELVELGQIKISSPDNLYVLLETGDEVLDYRLAEKKYKLCRKNIIQGGDHRFQSFETCLPEIIEFFDEKRTETRK